MLPSTAGAERSVTRRVGFVVALLAIAALAAPTIYVLGPGQAKASKPPLPQFYVQAPTPAPGSPAHPAGGALKAATAAPKVEFIPKLSAQEEQIERALDAPITLDIDESPLTDALDYVTQNSDVNFYVDEKSLTDVAVDPGVKITFHAKNRPLRYCLRQMIDRFDLTFFVADDVLTITSKSTADATIVTRTYPVGDLASAGLVPLISAPAAKPAEGTTETATGGESKRGVALNGYSRLMQLITSTIMPESWEESGGSGVVAISTEAKCLVISQSHAGHDAVLKLLRSLRAARDLADNPEGLPPQAEAHPSAEQANRAASVRLVQPKRLDVTELDPVTGVIHWPVILRDDRYAETIKQLNDLFKARASTSGFVAADGYLAIQAACDALQTELRKEIVKYGSQDYVRASRFVESLRLEAREPAT